MPPYLDEIRGMTGCLHFNYLNIYWSLNKSRILLRNKTEKYIGWRAKKLSAWTRMAVTRHRWLRPEIQDCSCRNWWTYRNPMVIKCFVDNLILFPEYFENSWTIKICLRMYRLRDLPIIVSTLDFTIVCRKTK